jgi:VanZ family protein
LKSFRAFAPQIAAALITLLIWVLSLLPIDPASVPGSDKFHHFIAYASLMFAWCLVRPATTLRPQVALAALCVAMGLAIECAQGLTGYRFFEWLDVLANSLGVMLGWLCFRACYFFVQRHIAPAASANSRAD